jgi:hypothetical protein
MKRDEETPDLPKDVDMDEETPPPFNPDPRLITEFERGRRRIEKDRARGLLDREDPAADPDA